MTDPHELLRWVAQLPPLAGLLLLGVSAGIEYVFPPFPGDTITLIGAVLAATAGWSWLGVFGALLAGSLAGAALNWRLGRWLDATRDRDGRLQRWMRRDDVAPRLDRLTDAFARHGSAYIALNRFLPAFRSLFFIAAGMAGLPLGRVLAFAALSAALWNALILAAGAAVGYNLDALIALGHTYSSLVWGVMIVGSLAWLGRRVWLARKQALKNAQECADDDS